MSFVEIKNDLGNVVVYNDDPEDPNIVLLMQGGPPGDTGAPGADGAVGPQGPPGPQGNTGLQGPPGPEGQTGVTTTTIADTAPPSPLHGELWYDSDSGKTFVWYDDGSSAQWVQHAAIIGASGPQGATGPAGPEGPQGSDGPAGDIGPAGPVGPEGPEGPIGPEGPVGITTTQVADTPPTSPAHGQNWFESDTGRTFIWYEDGSSGQWVQQSAIIGSQGPQGATGPQGPAGPQGPPGTGEGGGIPEAPIDAISYGRRDAGWVHVLMASNDVVDGGNFITSEGIF